MCGCCAAVCVCVCVCSCVCSLWIMCAMVCVASYVKICGFFAWVTCDVLCIFMGKKCVCCLVQFDVWAHRCKRYGKILCKPVLNQHSLFCLLPVM